MSNAPGAEHGNGHDHGHDDHHEPGFIGKYVFSQDHKVIGIQFLFTALAFMTLGGILALAVRWQLAWPYDLPMGKEIREHFPDEINRIAKEETPAESLADGDVILSVAGADVADGPAVHEALSGAEGAIEVTVHRGGRSKKEKVHLTAAADHGIRLVEFEGGAILSKVAATIAEAKILEKGDVVTGCSGYPVKTGADLQQILADEFLIGLLAGLAAEGQLEKILGSDMRLRRGVPIGDLESLAAAAGRDAFRAILDGMEGTPKQHLSHHLRLWFEEKELPGLVEPLRMTVYRKAVRQDVTVAGWVVYEEAIEAPAEGEEPVATVAEIGLEGRDIPAGPMVRDLDAYKYGMGGEFYTMLFTMHATIMIFFVIIPLLTGAFGNFLIPLQIGARDMAFPKLNMLSYWMIPVAAVIMIAGFFAEGGHAASGWTSYPPLAGLEVKTLDGVATPTPGSAHGQTYWLASLLIVGFSSIFGAVNYCTTIIKMRAPGMTFFRMPLSTWSLFITSILVLFGTPVLAAALTMQILDRTMGTSFFQAPYGGQPLLWQHVFWFYSHPAVYIMILPAMGMTSDILSTFARKPIFGYKAMVYSMGGIAFLGFIVWGHHMFQSGMNPYLGMTFMISTMMIALPSAIKTFNWLGTLWRSQIRFTVPMCHALAFVSMFVIGGLSGIYMAATPVDIFIHDTYFIVGHIHYVLFGGSLFALFGAISFWFPKMFGKKLNDPMGYVHFVTTFIAFNVTFFPMHIIGMAGHPRRIAIGWDKVNATGYSWLADVQWMNELMTYGALVLGAVQIIFFVNFLWSVLFGKKSGENPWKCASVEWVACPSPAPHGNFGPELPVIYHGPYEYSSPLVEDDDWLPQTRKLEAKATT